MTRRADLNDPLFIGPFIEVLLEAAGQCQMDAHVLHENGHEERVWQIAWEELSEAAKRIKARTAGLPDVMRHDPPDPWDEEPVIVDPAPPAPGKGTGTPPRLRLVRK